MLHCLSQWAQINFSTLNQRWFNVEPQLSSTILNVDIWLRNHWFCNNDQPKINFSTKIQPKINQIWSWNINVEKWLKFGWQLVDFRLRSWFLVEHCYKINDFSTNYYPGLISKAVKTYFDQKAVKTRLKPGKTGLNRSKHGQNLKLRNMCQGLWKNPIRWIYICPSVYGLCIWMLNYV